MCPIMLSRFLPIDKIRNASKQHVNVTSMQQHVNVTSMQQHVNVNRIFYELRLIRKACGHFSSVR